MPLPLRLMPRWVPHHLLGGRHVCVTAGKARPVGHGISPRAAQPAGACLGSEFIHLRAVQTFALVPGVATSVRPSVCAGHWLCV